jgi:hypothetical protein
MAGTLITIHYHVFPNIVTISAAYTDIQYGSEFDFYKHVLLSLSLCTAVRRIEMES